MDLTTFESVSRVGITAGASTPNKIIKEVHGRMDEMNFEELLKNDESRVSIKTGEIVEGRVIDVKPDEILVDISYKSDGIIPRSEYTNTPNADLTELVHVDDPITAKVVKTNDGEDQFFSHTRELLQRRLMRSLRLLLSQERSLQVRLFRL